MKVRLEVECPIRVGGREQHINKLEFVRLDGRIHAISPRKLAPLLLKKSGRALDDWYTQVLTNGDRADLTTFLEDQGLLDDPGNVEKVSRYSVPSDHDQVTEFQPHARDARGVLFIPGTAIKGAIRAAVMWARVDEKTASDYVQRNRGGARFFASELDREEMQSYELPRRKIRPGPHHDLMRAVKVPDAYGELESRVENIIIQSYSESQRGRTATLKETIHVECLVPGSWVELDLKVDENIIRDFQSRIGDDDPPLPFTDAGSLLELVRSFYEEVWWFERRYYGIKEGKSEELGESSSDPLSFEEWLLQEKGIDVNVRKPTNRERKPLVAEYRRTFNLFETDETGTKHETSGGEQSSSGIRDGQEVKVGKVREFYSGDFPGFRLGWGSGLMSTTVDLRLDERNMGKILNLIDQKHPKNKPIEGPKSRRLVKSGGSPRWPMGWASLEEV